MSAIRNSGRKAARASASPYGRPAPKKSSWSITGLLSFLNPLRSRSPVEETYESPNGSEFEEESFSAPDSPALSLNKRGRQLEHDLNAQGNVVPSKYNEQTFQDSPASIRSPPPASSPPPSDLESVSAHLRASLGAAGVEQLVSLLQDGKSAGEAAEPFRFSISPSTPARGNSPFQGNAGFSFGVSASQLSTPSPRRTLNKNPNGVYRWQGAGSAKTPRSKNRYSSPAFGPSRSTTDRLVLKDTQIGTETLRTDTKRRRVGEEAADSSFTSTGPAPTLSNGNLFEPPAPAAAPEPSPTRVKQPVPFPVSAGSPTTPRTSNRISLNIKASPSSSRLQVPPLTQKPTSPVIPSPLRQAWTGASPPSQSDSTPTTPSPVKQTKAAGFMADLIKEVTPPKRPDLSNPYQTASPVGKTGAPRARVGKRVRATGRPAAPPPQDAKKEEDGELEGKEKLYSPQAIIEATLPKGSKRSRPPSHLEKVPAVAREVSPPPQKPSPGPSSGKEDKRNASYVVEEVDEDVDEARRAAKRAKPHLAGRGTAVSNGMNLTPRARSPELVIEEVEDVDMESVCEKPESVTSPSPTRPPSTNIAAFGTAPSRAAFGGLKSVSAPKEPSKLRFSYQPESPAPPPPSTLAPESAPAPTIFTTAAAPPPPVTASFAFSAPTSKNKDVVEPSAKAPGPAKEAALTMPRQSLPTYSFSLTVTLPYSTTSLEVKTRDAAKSVPRSSLPAFDFSKPSLKNASPSATASTSVPAMKAFNWAAAGSRPPGATGEGTSWTCSTCMLSNPPTAVDKCTICDAPRAATATLPPPAKGFDWAAAGMKPPAPASSGTGWTCSTCQLSNPASATVKCTVCDTQR
ncbi:hypothetical protein LshimejAT787_1003520 [Lyophyllum shimeji]|uniref:RanBP2-type domain-containing protein n=1 Tax=Lyophyllum shimeji TaxID=47721 RepID=A0A9P3PS42_LYOSH|nr:hypothetical protein LshimejAT787_1003520 [Lyophyllum shimeji]